MEQQRMALWAAEELDEEMQDVDVNLAIGNYAQSGLYDDGPSSSLSSIASTNLYPIQPIFSFSIPS